MDKILNSSFDSSPVAYHSRSKQPQELSPSLPDILPLNTYYHIQHLEPQGYFRAEEIRKTSINPPSEGTSCGGVEHLPPPSLSGQIDAGVRGGVRLAFFFVFIPQPEDFKCPGDAQARDIG